MWRIFVGKSFRASVVISLQSGDAVPVRVVTLACSTGKNVVTDVTVARKMLWKEIAFGKWRKRDDKFIVSRVKTSPAGTINPNFNPAANWQPVGHFEAKQENAVSACVCPSVGDCLV